MKKIKTVQCFVFALFFSASLFSQGLVKTKLTYNPVLVNQSQQQSPITFRSFRSSSLPDTINLGLKGLIEVFASVNPYPDTAIWMNDSMAYINRGFGISPPSIGVATLDGLAPNGFPYNFNASPHNPSSADTLTSKPVNLNYPAIDSIYFSFYYQAQGYGNAPEPDDSLVLEFKAPHTPNTAWVHQWSQQGIPGPNQNTSALPDSLWHIVMIPITNPAFLQKGFQFRFRNYASIDASADQWNIDNIYLNKARTINDTIFNDITWVYNGTSLLKNYRAIPWKQYTQAEIVTSVDNLIKNADTVEHRLDYRYEILNITNSTVIDSSYNNGNTILPFLKDKIYTECDVSTGCVSTVPITVSKFPASLTGPTQIAIKHFFSGTAGDFAPVDDTLLVLPDNFSNYFAYDDGGAELAVDLLGDIGAQMAIKFNLNVADTLTAMDIYFDPFITNATLYTLYLNVWNDKGGVPGSIIFTSDSAVTPVYQKNGRNGFTRYYFNIPVQLGPGAFYVGFTQNTDSAINIGLDVNNNSDAETFYNIGNGGWLTSTIPGAVMLRPVFDTINPLDGIADYANKANKNNITVYPNPVNDKLYFKANSYTTSQDLSYQIMDVLGKVVMEGNSSVSDYIDVSGISTGVYIIKTIDANYTSTNKFIKTN